jgi:hypothetical protein
LDSNKDLLGLGPLLKHEKRVRSVISGFRRDVDEAIQPNAKSLMERSGRKA